MFCPHCGRSMPDGTHFCTECGTQIQMPQQAQQAQQPGFSYDQSAQPQSSQPTSIAPANVGNGGSQAQPDFGPLTTNRDLLTYILLCIVTCGIYGYWFVYKMAQDANVACTNDGDSTPGLAVYILLSIVTCGIYSYYWQYKLANRIQANAPMYGISIQEGGSDVLLWLLLGTFICFACHFIAMNIIIKNMNTLCAAYNRTHGYE